MLIAIDGPAGAGKSTVAHAVARELGYTYLDSGALYRCVALLSLERADPPATLARLAHIELGQRVLLDGRDVTAQIRTPEVSARASLVAADHGVRQALLVHQRQLIASGDWVAEGRDIGTVVAPEAELKIFLTAAPLERAQRRAQELGANRERVLAEQAQRDAQDSTREQSPLAAAEDAVLLDSTHLRIEQVVARIVALAHELKSRS
jgi:CMP/dCMP kinase